MSSYETIAALKEELAQKSEILKDLNNQQLEQIIQQKYGELDSLSSDNSKLQEVFFFPSSLPSITPSSSPLLLFLLSRHTKIW
jgi:hypothetical protein